MSKITLIQEFDSFEERQEFKIATQAQEMSSAIDEILQTLRKYDKYGHEFKSVEEAIEKIREEIVDIVNNHNIVLE
jgi:hypothetical protein